MRELEIKRQAEEKAERLLNELSVPNDLYVSLLTPYLSEKCRSLINRLQGDVKSYVKQYLLEQLRLVSSYFVDEFNRAVRQTYETFKSYIASLTSLLSNYVESRNVHDFEEFCQLLVRDRVESVLPKGAVSHLLRYDRGNART